MELKNLFLVITALCTVPVFSSIYHSNTFFTRVPKEETVVNWYNEVDPHTFIKDFSCEHIFSNITKAAYLNFYKGSMVNISADFLNTETMRRPPTLVIIPPRNKSLKFLVDIKYADFSGIQDIPNGYPEAECYIVPPYKPLMYVALYSPIEPTNIYALRELLKKCRIIGPPLSHDYPVHPFFLTGSRVVDKNDITLFTLGSMERLERLTQLAKVWDGPMSIAIPISNSSTEIPIIFDTWLNTPGMRRNVDIHLLYNDDFQSVQFLSKVFPINYLRDVAFINARTELVMFIEGDYIIPNDFREKMKQRIPLFLKENRTMFITFSFFGNKGLDPNNIPQSKAEIGKTLRDPNQDTFITNIFGYELYNFTHWLENDAIYNFSYPVKAQFEPYYVTHRNAQLYDETYVTWGFNKLTQILDMNAVGYSMKVIPDVFMIHLNHGDIKGFKNWRNKYRYDERHHTKVGTSMNRIQKLPGMLINTYYPPWLKNNMKALLCENYFGTQVLIQLREELVLARSTVSIFKTFLLVFLCILACLVTILITHNTNELPTKKKVALKD